MNLYLVSWDVQEDESGDRNKAVDESIRDLGKPGKGTKCVETTRTIESDKSLDEIDLCLQKICSEPGDKFVLTPVVKDYLRGNFGLQEPS